LFSSGCSGSPIFLPPPVDDPTSSVEDGSSSFVAEEFEAGRGDFEDGVEGTLANAEAAAEYDENAEEGVLNPPPPPPPPAPRGTAFFANDANPDVEAKAEKGEFEERGLAASVEGMRVEDEGVDEGIELEIDSGFFASGIELDRKGEAEKAVFVLGFWVSTGAGAGGRGCAFAGVETEANGEEVEENDEKEEPPLPV